MINFLKKLFLKFQKRKFITQDRLKAQKMSYVFQYLLSNYEIKLRGKLDLPPFYYAIYDIENILKRGELENAYDLIKTIIRKKLEGGKNEI